ncbi:hypothetical protein D9M73_253350 [compost metagenome]
MPRLSVFIGWLARAWTPRSVWAITSTSRMQPYTTMPSQPFFAAFSASMSPSRARRREPPPSTTRTLPWPGSSTWSLTSELSSKHLMVTISPPKESRPPKLLNMGSTTCTRSG